jgi:hypothetical protein
LRLGLVGDGAHERDLLAGGRDGACDGAFERLFVAHVVVGRQDDDLRVRVLGIDAREREQDAGAGAAVAGLRDDVDGAVFAELHAGEGLALLGHHDDDALGRAPPSSTSHRGLQQGAAAVDHRELLGTLFAV